MIVLSDINVTLKDLQNVSKIIAVPDGIPNTVLGLTSDSSLVKQAYLAGAVKVSADDSKQSYLENKITVGSNLTKSTVNEGGDEKLHLEVNPAVDDKKVMASATDDTPGYLIQKLEEGDNVTLSDVSVGMTLERKVRIDAADTDKFKDLTDTPSSYTDKAGQILKVNDSEDAVEFTDGLRFGKNVMGSLSYLYGKLHSIEAGNIYDGNELTGTLIKRQTWVDSIFGIERDISANTKDVKVWNDADFTVFKLAGTGDRYIGADENGKLKEMAKAVQGEKRLLESDYTITDTDAEITGLRLNKTGNKVAVKYRLFTGSHTVSPDTLVLRNQNGDDLGASLHIVDVKENTYDSSVVNIGLDRANLAFIPGLSPFKLYEININLIDTEASEIRLFARTTAGNNTVIQGYLSCAEITNYS